MQGPAVAFSGLTKRFAAKTAVDHVDLEIPNGSFFGICGPNGAGTWCGTTGSGRS